MTIHGNNFVIVDTHSQIFKNGYEPKTKQVKISWDLKNGYKFEDYGEPRNLQEEEIMHHLLTN